MPPPYKPDLPVKGLSKEDIPVLQKQYGKNIFYSEPQRQFYHIVVGIVKEPMFILLVMAATLYFIVGEAAEGFMMLGATGLVVAISLYQDVKSSNAIKALQQFTQPQVTVIRDGSQQTIAAEELVPGDMMELEEGMKIPADAVAVQQNDFSVNESVITGESLPVDKEAVEGRNRLYQGTTINSGKALAKVTATGNNTELGKLGKAVGMYQPPKTFLQMQIGKFVRNLALFGLLAFAVILLVNYSVHKEFVTSLLFALTLAMSAIPEEIPVAFSSFMALGAYKMSRLGIISRQSQVVENLGAVTVVCLDKTGTITENSMQVKAVYNFNTNAVSEPAGGSLVLYHAVMASEKDPFDAMEKAIWKAYTTNENRKDTGLAMIHEYPLEGRPPMMTHVYRIDGIVTATAKGAMERIVNVCSLDEADIKTAETIASSFTSKGYRVIAVASAAHPDENFPAQQDDFNWRFEGLLALYDPPKQNIKETFEKFKAAKINIKIITGDHPATTLNIASQVGIDHKQKYFTGDDIVKMSEAELSAAVHDCSIFARMFPDAKLKVVEALKANGEIVAMTGDGVNDGPALKAADIGIAMGKKGTEIAKQAADLVLTDDNLDKIVMAVSEGRKIFSNLKKAVRYIISIHIPIILVAAVPLILGWKFPNIFSPVHVIFLEIIMGPTCSIFFEREPVEENGMLQAPRNRKTGLFTWPELALSIVQGIVIAVFVLLLYFYFMNRGFDIKEVRTIVFTTLILSNMFLTFANRSFSQTIFITSRYKNNLAPFVIIVSAAFIAGLYYWAPVKDIFELSPVTANVFLLCLAVAFTAVMWFEVYKSTLVKK
jgi:P-type Ca2+ transporter type 2C